jgi:hypothetical protein
MKGGKLRWWGWAGALALTLVAIQWVDSGEAPPSRDAAIVESTAPAESTREARPAGTQSSAASEIRLDRLQREPYPPLKSDPFRGDLALDPISGAEGIEGTGAGQRNTGPQAPPPLPFTYMGKMLEDGKTLVFLTRGDRNYVVRKGATLDGLYRVDEIGARTMELTYLPAKVKQSLAIGSAP